ncbi:MAG: hypothetical protein A2539_05185 [Elusimicrobia bacterium RIFOXYD2_FULL_34_15]|nr:MAG: hypothetical protein A2539_05185 [Elusimicrobia bacterium RIFOXYD2_FULL_34_15]
MKRKVLNLVVLACVCMCMGLTGCFVTTSKYRLKSAEADKNKADADQLNKKLTEVTNEKKNLETELTNVKKSLSDMEANNKDLLNTLEAKKSEKDKIIADLTRTKQDLEAKINDLNQQLDVISKEKEQAIKEKEEAVAKVKNTYDSLVKSMESEIQKGEILITQLQDKLTVNLVDKILFSSGEAVVKKDGQKVLERVGEILKKIEDKQILIEGHTDNVPIGKDLESKFPTNWELSSARATNVARYLIDKVGIDPSRISVAGYADQRPIDSNTTPEGKARNRRIEIVLIPLDVNRVVVPAVK